MVKITRQSISRVFKSPPKFAFIWLLVSDNVDLIKTVPQSMLEDMKEIIAEGYDEARSGADIAKQI